MSDADEVIVSLSAKVLRLDLQFLELARRLTAIEAELAVMRGTQSASRWSGDSPPMTIEPQPRD